MRPQLTTHNPGVFMSVSTCDDVSWPPDYALFSDKRALASRFGLSVIPGPFGQFRLSQAVP